MKQLVLYGSPECHLCEIAKGKLERVRRFVPFTLREVDVRSNAALLAHYGTRIPVITANGREVAEGKITEFRLLRALVVA